MLLTSLRTCIKPTAQKTVHIKEPDSRWAQSIEDRGLKIKHIMTNDSCMSPDSVV